NPYIIDCKGANWDNIIDWEGAEDIPVTDVYDKIRLEEEDGHYYLELREHGQAESQYESFATVEDAAQWAEKELGEEIARRFRDAEPEFLKDPFSGGRRQLEICDGTSGWVKPVEEDDGWYLEPKKTRDVVAEAFEDPDCDGVIFKNVVDNGGGVVDAYEDDVYVVRESKQVKLVDEMTYADDGSIIPAEARLDWSNPDVRFSVAGEKKTTVQGPLSESDQTPPVQFNGGATSIPLTLESADPVTKFADSISQDGAKSPADFLTGLVHALGSEETNPDKTQYFDIAHEDGKHLSLRVANHRATAAQYREHGNTADVKTSIVVKMSDKPFRPDSDVEMTEHVYFSDKLTTEREAAIANAVADWIATGEWNGPVADQVNTSPSSSPDVRTEFGRSRFSVDQSRLKPATQEEFDRAIASWGEMKVDDSNAELAKWLFPDGRVLQPKLVPVMGGRVMAASHDSLFEFLDRPERTDPVERFEYGYADALAGGAIRLDLGNAGIEVARRPTDGQLDALYGILDAGYAVMEGEDYDNFAVDVDSETGGNAFTAVYRRGTSARKIVDDLREYFDSGSVPAAAGARYSIGGIYTGTAADYASRSRQGGVDDGPSLLKIGTGEGSQVYGWGLYGSTVRGVAENYMPRERTAEEKAHIEFLKRSAANETQPALKKYWEDELRLAQHPQRNLYEQTFFTDRAPGDESHLLKWYEPVSEKQIEWVAQAFRRKGHGVVKYGTGKWNIIDRYTGDKTMLHHESGEKFYEGLSTFLGSPKAASEFLARAGIDGVKYPVDSYGGKAVKDGDKAGWNYVSFRDDNIRVDHKWTDGQLRYSVVTLGNYNTQDLRNLAHRIKDGDSAAIADAGRRLAKILPKNAVLVPMPSHTGEPTTMRSLADSIAANADGATVVDALRSNPHESSYDRKKRGVEPEEVEMRRIAEIPKNKEVYIVDNVIDTGATYHAAMRAIRDAHMLALADTDKTPAELRQTIAQNIDHILSRFDKAKGLSKKDIFAKFDNRQLEIGWLPSDLALPDELQVAKRSVMGAEAFILDHIHNKPGHELVLTVDDARRMLANIDPKNEMRVVPQRGSLSLAFIAPNPANGWDCTVIAPHGGALYVFKTMFAQTRKPYQDKSLIRYSVSVRRNEAADRLIRGGLSSIRDFSETPQSIPQTGAPAQGGEKRLSVAPPRRQMAYPLLRLMSDDELVSAAVAVRMALGASDKFSDKAVKVNTVQGIMRRLHPDWDTTTVGRESQRVISDAKKFGRQIRDDLDRGVSESRVLAHLPDKMREAFGTEMREEARRGQRLGTFGEKVSGEIEERQARVIEDAVRVQTGLDASVVESTFGVDLSETLMHLADNPLKDGAPASGQSASGDAVGDDAQGGEQKVVDVPAAVAKAVSEVVERSRRYADENAEKRKARKAEQGQGEAGDSTDGQAGLGHEDEGDPVAVATRKAGLDLENPRHLAEFVAELTRRYWIKDHGLAQTADVWRDLVAVQFLRKTAQSVYAKLCRELTYSRSRETAMQRIAKFDAVPTVAGLLSEMEFVGALINAQRIRDTKKGMCEKLDLFLREQFGAQGRFKPDREEGARKVSAEAELRARYMRHAMWLTPDAAALEAGELQRTIDELSVDFKDAGRDRDQSREFVDAIRKLNVLREFGALRYRSLGEIESAARWWEDFARGSSDDIVREMSDREIRTKKAAHLLAVAFADPKRANVREGAGDWLNRFITGHMGFVSLLQDCMRGASAADAAAVKDIVDYIAREIQKTGDRSEAEKRRHNDAFHAAVESIYGRGFNAVMKEMMAPDERFAKYMGVVGGKRVTPTKGRALQLLVSLLQEGRRVEVEDEENPGKTKFVWEGGYHDNIVKHHREGQAQELMKLLTPQDMNMLKWLGAWYEQNRSGLSDVCRSLFG
ncbi:MAG: hypothetical protein IKQ17_12050, partial [Kiritimatiellae bacterium]|nr:hypothetical protein [Kiritimatiellia bacterium]